MDDMAYIVSRTLEHKIAIAENNDQNTILITLDVLKDVLAMLKEQRDRIIVRCKYCKHGNKAPTFKYYPDVTWCNKYLTSHNDDWFCADGTAKAKEYCDIEHDQDGLKHYDDGSIEP